jgi:hypothetical protein
MLTPSLPHDALEEEEEEEEEEATVVATSNDPVAHAAVVMPSLLRLI